MSRSSTHSPIRSASETSPREALPPLARLDSFKNPVAPPVKRGSKEDWGER